MCMFIMLGNAYMNEIMVIHVLLIKVNNAALATQSTEKLD